MRANISPHVRLSKFKFSPIYRALTFEQQYAFYRIVLGSTHLLITAEAGAGLSHLWTVVLQAVEREVFPAAIYSYVYKIPARVMLVPESECNNEYTIHSHRGVFVMFGRPLTNFPYSYYCVHLSQNFYNLYPLCRVFLKAFRAYDFDVLTYFYYTPIQITKELKTFLALGKDASNLQPLPVIVFYTLYEANQYNNNVSMFVGGPYINVLEYRFHIAQQVKITDVSHPRYGYLGRITEITLTAKTRTAVVKICDEEIEFLLHYMSLPIEPCFATYYAECAEFTDVLFDERTIRYLTQQNMLLDALKNRRKVGVFTHLNVAGLHKQPYLPIGMTIYELADKMASRNLVYERNFDNNILPPPTMQPVCDLISTINEVERRRLPESPIDFKVTDAREQQKAADNPWPSWIQRRPNQWHYSRTFTESAFAQANPYFPILLNNMQMNAYRALASLYNRDSSSYSYSDDDPLNEEEDQELPRISYLMPILQAQYLEPRVNYRTSVVVDLEPSPSISQTATPRFVPFGSFMPSLPVSGQARRSQPMQIQEPDYVVSLSD